LRRRRARWMRAFIAVKEILASAAACFCVIPRSSIMSIASRSVAGRVSMIGRRQRAATVASEASSSSGPDTPTTATSSSVMPPEATSRRRAGER